MKKNYYQNLLLRFIYLILFFLVSVLLFNYYFDGDKQFFKQKSFETSLTNKLLHEENVMVCSNYNDRSVQRFMLQHLLKRPQVLVLGSSRTMPINQNLFKKRTFYNASITSASLEDDIALFNIFQKKWQNPDVVILSLDPWILGVNEGKTQWRTTFFTEYGEGKKLLLKNSLRPTYKEKIQGVYAKYIQLLSFNYFKDSLKNIPLIRNALKLNMPLDGLIAKPANIDSYTYPSCITLFPDGSHYFSRNDEYSTAAQVESLSSVQIQNIDSMIVEDKHRDIFEAFIKYLLKQKIKVVFYFPAYEPHAYYDIESDSKYNTINLVEQYFLAISRRYHIEVIGSYNPNIMSLNSVDFIDYIHLKRKSIDKVFNKKLV